MVKNTAISNNGLYNIKCGKSKSSRMLGASLLGSFLLLLTDHCLLYHANYNLSVVFNMRQRKEMHFSTKFIDNNIDPCLTLALGEKYITKHFSFI